MPASARRQTRCWGTTQYLGSCCPLRVLTHPGITIPRFGTVSPHIVTMNGHERSGVASNTDPLGEGAQIRFVAAPPKSLLYLADIRLRRNDRQQEIADDTR